MKKMLLLFSLIVFCFSLRAQESIGLFNDNYLPVNAMLKNPAAAVFSPFKWQVNLVSAGLFAENNFVYTPSQNNFKLLSTAKNKLSPQINFTDVNNAHAHFYSFVQGPSAFYQFNQFTFGIISDTKYAGSLVSNRASQQLDATTRITNGQDYVVPSFKTAYMHWTEIGINVGTVIKDINVSSIAAGINVKYLGSTDGLYFNNNHEFYLNRDSVYTQQSLIDVNFGYTSTAGINRPASPANFNFNGRGIGTDIGLLYTINSNDESELYDWKFGVSLVDIGFIEYKKQSSTYILNRSTLMNEPTSLLQQTNDLSSLADNGSQIVYDAIGKAYTGSKYMMVLPGSISVTAEKSFTHGFYLSALVVRRIPLGENQIKRANTVAITPSFEKKWIAVAIPVVMYEDRKVYAGTSFRIGPLTIGSDNIISWLIPSDYFGTDVYVGLHLNPFNNGNNNGRKNSGKHLPHFLCPKF